jgi:hypothetical protein
MSVEDTARAVLAHQETFDEELSDDWVLVNAGIGTDSTRVPLPDLHRMARLWLMRSEIETFITASVDKAKADIAMNERSGQKMLETYFGVPDVQAIQALLARLKELEGE